MSKSGFVGIIVADLLKRRLSSIARGPRGPSGSTARPLLPAGLDDGQKDIGHILKHFAASRTGVLLLALGEDAAPSLLALPSHSALERCLAACSLWVLIRHSDIVLATGLSAQTEGLGNEDVGRFATEAALAGAV